MASSTNLSFETVRIFDRLFIISSDTEMCKTVQEKLKKGHKDVCPWQASPCPVSFLSLPNHSRDGWHSYLRNAFEKLLTLGKDMPLLDEDVLDKMVCFVS